MQVSLTHVVVDSQQAQHNDIVELTKRVQLLEQLYRNQVEQNIILHQQNQINYDTFRDQIKQEVKNEILQQIKTDGLQVGNRWIIREEGTGSYEALVFRDQTQSQTQDSRYAMFKERYTDL